VRERVKKTMIKNRILIVDDENDINLLFKMVLEDKGYKVDTFNDPLVALQNFTDGAYDLLLLDMLMPNMNGFELYQKIRMMDNKVRICFLTAGRIDYEEFKKRAVSVASIENNIENCFIIKPIENEELIKIVKSQLL
jgi:two-component system copper resistance phosphate regulon response regulator CusR